MTHDSSVRSGGAETRWYVERDESIYVYEAEPMMRDCHLAEMPGPDFPTELEAVRYALDCAIGHREQAQMDINTFRRRLRTIAKRKPTALHKGNINVHSGI